MKQRTSRCALVAFLLVGGNACAVDKPAFDRPGIAFSTSTLPRGGLAWEQGLPDFGTDSRQGLRTTTWIADTLFRLGVADTVELQLGVNTYVAMQTSGNGVDSSDHGSGDGWGSVKWAPSSRSDTFSWACLATATVPFGEAPLGGGGHDYGLGVTASWALPSGTGVSLYVNRSWGDHGAGWLFSPSYSFPVSESVSGYVEAGAGTGAAYTRVAGGGVAWMVTQRIQIDASFLRGLNSESPDWQGGIGMAWYFD